MDEAERTRRRKWKKEMARRIFEHLNRLLHSARFRNGWVLRIELACGWRRGWWRERRKRWDLYMSDFVAVTKTLGLHPGRVVVKALAGELDRGLLRWGLDRPVGVPPPPIVGMVARRLRAPAADRRDCPLDRSYLDQLDRERYRDPVQVVERAERAVDQVEPSLLPRLLGVAASAYRTAPVPRLDEATLVIERGLELAHEGGDKPAEADLLVRLAYVLGDTGGQYSEALDLAGKAAFIYLDAGDDAGFGRATLDRAMFLYYLERIGESISGCRASLTHLPLEAHESRFTALMGLGLCHQRIGEVDAAGRAGKQAAKLLPELGLEMRTFAEGKLFWLLGQVARDSERLELSDKYFRRAVEGFSKVYPLDAALAGTELVRVRLLRGLPHAALEAAWDTEQLTIPLRGNKLACAAIAELASSSSESLTLAVLERIQRQLESARARPDSLSYAR